MSKEQSATNWRELAEEAAWFIDNNVGKLDHLIDYEGKTALLEKIAAAGETIPSETPRSAAVESLIGQLRKHVSHNVCEDAWYSCSQADCADDRRAGHPCDCGAQRLNELHAHAADALERTVSATPCSDPDWKVDSAPLHWPYSEREAWKGGYYAAMTLYKVHKERA